MPRPAARGRWRRTTGAPPTKPRPWPRAWGPRPRGRPALRSRSAPPLWRWRTRIDEDEPLEEASIDQALIDPSPSPTYAVATTGVIDIIPFEDGDPETDAYGDGRALDGDPDVEALGEIDEELSDPAMADEPETLTGDRPWETYVKTDADLEADAFFASFTAREAAEAAAAEAAAADASADEAPAEGTPADEAPADELAAEETSVEETPADEAPAEETPAEPVSESEPDDDTSELGTLADLSPDWVETDVRESGDDEGGEQR